MLRTPCWIALSFALGVGLGDRLRAVASVPALWAVACAGLLVALLARRQRAAATIAALVAVACFGALRVGVDEPFPEALLSRASVLRSLSGVVASYPDIRSDRVSFTFRPDALPANVEVYVHLSSPADGACYGLVHRGDHVRVSGTVRLPEPFDGFDYPTYLARHGVFATMSVDGDEGLIVESPGRASLLGWGDRVRQTILRRLADALGSEIASMAQSLLFGDRTALPEEIESAFSRTGLLHLLAVSGLHLGILLGGIWWALRRLGLRPRWTYPMVGCVVLLALWIVGPRVSLVRAGLLFGFLGLGSVLADCGVILRRSIDPLNALAAAAIVLLAVRPGALFEAGFQLTVSATAAILIAFSPPLSWGERISAWSCGRPRLDRPMRATLGLLAVAAAAQAGAGPIIAWHFGSIHPWAILANVIVVPLAAMALWSGFLGLLLVAAPWGTLAVIPFEWMLRALRWTVERLAMLPGSAIPIPRGLALWMGVVVAFAFGVAIYVRGSASSPGEGSLTSYSTSIVPDPSGDDGR